MTTMIQELAAHPELIYRHTVDDYHEIIANGSIIEGEPFELLDGQIVRKIRAANGEGLRTVGIEHSLIVSRLGKMSGKFEQYGCHVRTQQPISLPPNGEPEPDAVIARGTIEDYTLGHPLANDIPCIIEFAESSLGCDRGYKLQLYANAGIAMYVIVNLNDRVLEVYHNPIRGSGKFGTAVQLRSGQTADFPTVAGTQVTIPVDQMFR